MIDLIIDWIEICIILSAQTDLVANQVELDWLIYYKLPSKVIMDRGNKILAKIRNMKINDYSIKGKTKYP